MCLAVFALDVNSRFPLVIAANRDEFMNRSTARLSWWNAAGKSSILGGRDHQSGGTWMGLNATGRLALLTNVRNPAKQDNAAPSRGEVVPLWLNSNKCMHELWPQLAMHGYNGFNLVAFDFSQGECFWVSNMATHPKRLEKGIFGISNAQLNTPWPKLNKLKAETKLALSQSKSVDELSVMLFSALTDTTQAPDIELPNTGVSLEWERLLSSAFIRSPDGLYGTRCSTLIITERINKRLTTHVLERTYSSGNLMALLRRVTLRNWPPKHTASVEEIIKLDKSLTPSNLHHEETFESSDVLETENHALEFIPARKKRARYLLKK